MGFKDDIHMKMPEKITAWEFMPSEQNEYMLGGWDVAEERSHEMKSTSYIRADIVDELVRAMGNLLVIEGSADPMYTESIAMRAMLRINAIMEGK